MKPQPVRFVIVVVALLAACLSVAHAQQTGKKEHTFRGKVEKVDAKAKVLGAMTMTYAVDKADVIDKVKAGDQITAKVYDGDFKTLHDVQVVPSKDKK